MGARIFRLPYVRAGVFIVLWKGVMMRRSKEKEGGEGEDDNCCYRPVMLIKTAVTS
jgi:hypothetical protein